MEPRSLRFIAEACDGELLSGSPETLIRRLSTDSRQLHVNDLFVALEGEKFDGHDFLPEVFRKGACAAMVHRSKVPRGTEECAIIAVEDTRRALGRFAARYRQDFDFPFIAIGGSNGKTTTKELVASVLRERFKVLRSEASFNNDVGVPLTLLNLRGNHEAAVVEVGTNHPGELAPLVKMIQPRYGILTNIAREHLEYFGDLEGVAEEEGSLAELLPENGKLFVDGDCLAMSRAISRTRATVVRVGFHETNDWRVRDVKVTESGVKFDVEAPDSDLNGEYEVRLLGRHQVRNALLAVAVGRELGLSRAEIQHGLAECAPPKMRLQLWKIEGLQILDDTYNANADSMRAALQTLHEFPCRGRRVAVLGDMAELGRHCSEAHAEVGRHAAELGISHLFAVGKMSAIMADSARAAGLEATRAFSTVEDAAAALRDFLRPGDVVLLKASRATRLERLTEILRTHAAGKPAASDAGGGACA
ncbi:MAG: UDP-N-acetylmuramoyl-tripeptide--D-alanyl-D-alanine ligase [Verrucomicrobia bacterium]|nr:UDP-N-acetylmuramoyl-tripeptide--D-alanyl-D-alanine ligase [Verrucomicrobiota bacterium]